ncbi:discoidin domain-containing protein [Candidatus Pacearchaeota archaeon]|nr:discoidin domain-containing protein [Candidatus Pacearchaeota archaeon]
MLKRVLFLLLFLVIPFVSASLSCTDNEPRGLPTVRGALEVKQAGTLGREFYADVCLSPTLLKEYTCEGTEPVATEHTCEGICSEGACVQGERKLVQLQNTIALSYCGEYGFETPLTASAPALQAYPATNAVDQQRETHWFGQPGSTTPQLLIDNGEGKCMDFATLFFFIKDIPLTASLEASIDGAVWKEILPPTIITEQKKDISFNPLYARYLRLTQTSTSRAYGQLSEIVISTAEVPDLQLTQLTVVAGASGSVVPYASFTFNGEATPYQTDQYGKATLVAPKETMTEVQVTCPTTAGTFFTETPLSVTPTVTFVSPRFSFFSHLLSVTGNVIFGDPELSFKKLSQTECSVTGAQNEEFEVPGGYSYSPSCSCSDKVLELTGEYKAVPEGANYMDLFLFLVKGGEGYRMRTANQESDTPQTAVSKNSATLADGGFAYGFPLLSGEEYVTTNYLPNTWVPFHFRRNYDELFWEVNGQAVEYQLPTWGMEDLELTLGAWTHGGKNMIRNTKLVCGEADPAPEDPAPPTPPKEEEKRPKNVTNSTNVTNGTITLPTFEREVVPELVFEVVQVRDTLSKLANRKIQQQACGEFQLVSPPEIYASDTRRPYVAQLAVDNNLSSGWYGNPDAPFPKIITADFNQEICMNRLDMYVAQAETPLLIEIQVSTDGKIWDTLVKNYNLESDRYVGVPFPTTVVGRYVRIIEHASARPFGTLQEVYISAAPRVVAQPFLVKIINEAGERLSNVPITIRVGSEATQEVRTQEGETIIPDAFSLQGKTIEVACPIQ